MRLSPDLPEAHLALALVKQSVDRDLEAAGRELDAVHRLLGWPRAEFVGRLVREAIYPRSASGE